MLRRKRLERGQKHEVKGGKGKSCEKKNKEKMKDKLLNLIPIIPLVSYSFFP